MKKHIFGFIKSILFLTILCFSLYFINMILRPKYTPQNSNWPSTTSYLQFYEMKENSVDVLFLGSSVTVNAFSPQEIYNNYGIRSYNLGSEQQSFFFSYYWLKEALRTQSPKVVVLDTRFLLSLHPSVPLNMKEPMVRKCMDPMKWSSVKCEAIADLCSIDPEHSEMSYYLTNLRYHTRWTEADESDLDEAYYSSSQLKGFSVLSTYGAESFKTYDPNPNRISPPEIGDLMLKYLDKTVELCKENGITLVLLSLPGNAMNDGIHFALTDYAAEHGLDYYNFCETDQYAALGAELPRENTVDHSNLWGAIRLSNYMGNLLREKYQVAPVSDPQYETTKDYYERIKENAELSHITDPLLYFQKIRENRYTLFLINVRNAYKQVTDDVQKTLETAGLQTDLRTQPLYSYSAMMDPETGVQERFEEGYTNSLTGSLRDHSIYYKVSGSGTNSNGTVQIDKKTYTLNKSGINLLVYDTETGQVLDIAVINTNGLSR